MKRVLTSEKDKDLFDLFKKEDVDNIFQKYINIDKPPSEDTSDLENPYSIFADYLMSKKEDVEKYFLYYNADGIFLNFRVKESPFGVSYRIPKSSPLSTYHNSDHVDVENYFLEIEFFRFAVFKDEGLENYVELPIHYSEFINHVPEVMKDSFFINLGVLE